MANVGDNDNGQKPIIKKINNLDLSAIEKIIILNEGTVQELLSVTFHTNILIDVLSQMEDDGTIIRWIRLHGEYKNNDTTFGFAQSVIPVNKNTPGIITGIREKRWGIGKIIESTGINTKRDIFGVFADDFLFSRNYIIRGIEPKSHGLELNKNIHIIITETFKRNYFENLK